MEESREDGTPEQVRAAFVTTNTFRLLGVKIALGRDFEEADGTPQPDATQPQAGASPGTPAPPRLPTIAILSYWQRRFGGNTAILGRQTYAMELTFQGGWYDLGLKTIAAGETAIFDIRALRDQQVPDPNNSTIPLDVAWAMSIGPYGVVRGTWY